MIHKLVSLLILLPLAILMAMLAVANRQDVVVSFDPFNPSRPAYSVTLPLYALSLALLGSGVVLGGVAAWLRQSRWRRAARRAQAETRAARAEVARMERGLKPVELPARTIRAEEAPRRTVAPPPA